eukprot:TRINITY_DN2208_c0_g1_i1.p4 TRINITY_DN2208_c0_g1~~TRINITY_DN2208_c0_g1_i1.p4  ORF type:complete len:71 (+),score=9.21 TRINITY_DN2208_c0_g1_i1:636-848(+)
MLVTPCRPFFKLFVALMRKFLLPKLSPPLSDTPAYYMNARAARMFCSLAASRFKASINSPVCPHPSFRML